MATTSARVLPCFPEPAAMMKGLPGVEVVVAGGRVRLDVEVGLPDGTGLYLVMLPTVDGALPTAATARLDLFVDPGLAELFAEDGAGSLPRRLRDARIELGVRAGAQIPPLHCRDRADLAPGQYQLCLDARPVAAGEVRRGAVLVLAPEGLALPDVGSPCVEPVFGLPARWVAANERAALEARGYTVVDPATAILTHVADALRRHVEQFFDLFQLDVQLADARVTPPAVLAAVHESGLGRARLLLLLRRALRAGRSIGRFAVAVEALVLAVARHGVDAPDDALLAEVLPALAELPT